MVKKTAQKSWLTRLSDAMWFRQLPVMILIATAAFIIGTRSAELTAGLTTGNQRLAVSELQVLFNELHANYDGKLDAKKALEGAKKGLVEATGDPYTTFFTAEEAKEFNDDLNGKYEGIGAELGKRHDNVVIISTMDNSPAKKAGLLAGDTIVKIDGQETLAWSVEKAVTNIRGKKGTKVTLTILRDAETKEVTIVRANITDPSVKAELLNNHVGYIRISRFGDDTSTLASQKSQELSDQGAEAYILDLRGNGGGRVPAAQAVASLWLENVTIATEKRHDGQLLDTVQAFQHAPLKGRKTIVLIDGGSASASEIVAGALHDHNVAQLVGEKTFGKGSVQSTIDGVGGQLKVTIAKWYTPDNKNITKEGIAPDIVVKQTPEDLNAGQDPQKDKALELLR